MNLICQNCSAEINVEDKQQGHNVECESCGTETRYKLTENIVPGNLINDYLLTDLIGSGAMGQVFKAKHLLMKKEVAVKVIRVKDQSEDREKLIDQFISELQTSAQLEHPNIVTVTDAGVCDGVVYLVMQYLEGMDLSAHIEKLGFMKEKQALVIVSELASALDYAWEEFGMIHRDLKPENIRITKRGEVKLMDFGLAKIIDATSPSKDDDDDEHFHIVGTPDFMSPEQALDKPNIDARADIYSMGYLLMYMLTGKRIFTDKDPMIVVKQHLGEHPKPLDEYNPEIRVSDSTLELLTKMVKKDRDKRFVSWKVLAQEIDALLAGDIKAREEAAAAPEKPAKAKVKTGPTVKVAHSEDAPARRRPKKKKKKNGCATGCLVIFLILFLMFLVTVGAIVAMVKGALDKASLPENLQEILKPIIEQVEQNLGESSSSSDDSSDESAEESTEESEGAESSSEGDEMSTEDLEKLFNEQNSQ